MSETEHAVLAAAAEAARLAPSIFNTQPWQWRVDANSLELYADRDRQLGTTDPNGWFLVLSCGASLHHARVALAAAGWRAVVMPFPGGEPDLLARIRLVEPAAASADDLRMSAAIRTRRTDRRPFGEQPVADAHLDTLTAAARRERAQVHAVRHDQVAGLASAVAAAERTEASDSAYRAELSRWTNRLQWSMDGVPAATGVVQAARRVPVRDFVTRPGEGMTVEPGGDLGARYLILYGGTDEPLDWLRAGEAASALLLTAAGLGLAVAPISDVIEVERSRDLVRALLPGGAGRPHLVVRCGHPVDATALAEAPRRDASEVIKGPRP